MLTVFFATVFATLLLLRPEPSDPIEPTPANPYPTQIAPRVKTPPVNAPPVSAPPPEPILKNDPKPEPKPTIQTRLEQLGIKCAEGANCDPPLGPGR
jgi:hypothetical protein